MEADRAGLDVVNRDELETVCRHEASHAAAAARLGRPIDFVMRETGDVELGKAQGKTRVPLVEDRDIEEQLIGQLVISLAGYLLEWRRGWPPPYVGAVAEPLENVGLLIGILDLDRTNYTAITDLTRRLVCDRRFLILRRGIAAALMTTPRLESDDLHAVIKNLTSG
jgi:hypothetical protein